MKNNPQRQVDLMKTGVLQTANLDSKNCSSIATDTDAVIHIFCKALPAFAAAFPGRRA